MIINVMNLKLERKLVTDYSLFPYIIDKILTVLKGK